MTDETIDQGAGDDWKAGLSDDLRSDPGLNDIKDINGLASSFLSSQRMLGSRIPIPSEDAGEDAIKEFQDKLTQVPGVVKIPSMDNPDELNAFYKALGRPDEVAGYEIKRPENLPEGVDYREDMEDWFKNIAFENGLNNTAVQNIMNAWNELSAQEGQARLDQKNATTDELRKEWGADFERRQGLAHRVVKEFASDDVLQELVETGLGNNPHLIKMLSNIGMKTLEDGVIQNPISHSPQLTPAELDEKINELMNNPAYMDAHDINHKTIVNKVFELQKKLSDIQQTTNFETITV